MESAVHSRKRALVLLNSGFDAFLTISAIKQLRLSGANVLTLTLTADWVRDDNGICLCADKSLSDFQRHPEDRFLIIPGGKPFLLSLLTDPRVHQLLQIINDNEGFIFVSEQAKTMIDKMEEKRPFTQSRFIFLKNSDPQIIPSNLTHLLID